MTSVTPVKPIYAGSTVTALGEFAAGDVIGVEHGGTGATTAADARAALDAVGPTDTQTLTNKTLSGADNTLLAIPNTSLDNSSITFGATAVSLGGTVSGLDAVAIGGTTAAAGAFTTLSASSTVSGTGFSTYLASPPAIGGTTPAAGAFTTLSSTGNTTLGDASTDTVTVNGYMGVGGSTASSSGIYISSNALVGTGIRGIRNEITIPSSATATAYAYSSSISTAAASFTVGNVAHFRAANANIGAGSTITNQYGISIEDLASATNNYGIVSAVSSGTNKWNIYASGTAANYFAGNVLVGATTSSVTSRFAVIGNTGGACASFEDSDLFNRPVRFTNTGGGVSFDIRVGTGTTLLETNGAQNLGFATDNTERLRITSSGNVGIGAASPLTKIHANGTAATPYATTGSSLLPSTSEPIFGFTTGGQGCYLGAANTGSGYGANMVFGTSTGAASYAERLRIDSAGSLLLRQSSNAANTSVSFNTTVQNALTLDASGNLIVNGTSSLAKITVYSGSITATGAGGIASNLALGQNALLYNTTGYNNVACGQGALQNNTTGYSNTACGRNALYSNTTGASNSALGSQFSTSGTYAPAFNCTTENNRVSMAHLGVTNAYIQVAWTVVSDARDKTNFNSIPHGLDFVNQLNPVSFQFRVDRDSEETNGGVRYGFKAQEILALEGDNPVIIDNEDPDKLRYQGESLVPVLVNAIKELTARLETLEGKVNK